MSQLAGSPAPAAGGAPTSIKLPQAPKNEVADAIGKFLRANALLKTRTGLNAIDGANIDFFRYKRCVRALLSEDYKKLQKKTNSKKNVQFQLPDINDASDAQKIFILLIQSQMVVPVDKLSSAQAKEKGLKIKKNFPYLLPTKKAALLDDNYFIFTFQNPNPFLILYSILGLVAVFGVILFPLWPFWMRKGVWYLSTGLLCLLGLFFAIAIVRLIIYVITLATMKSQLWIFPNLFEDCGFIESFQPLYGWSSEESSTSVKKKTKKNAGSANGSETIIPQTKTTSTTQSKPASTQPVQKVQRQAKIEEIED